MKNGPRSPDTAGRGIRVIKSDTSYDIFCFIYRKYVATMRVRKDVINNWLKIEPVW